MVKAILWDNDGVLVDTEHLYYKACREVLLRYNISFDEERYIDLFLRKSEGLLAILHENGLTEKLDTAQNWRNKRYSELLLDGIGAIGGVTDTLEILKSRVQMGIVTSCKRAHFDLIHSKTEVLKFFDFVLAREDYFNSKPDPEPYLEAMRRNHLKPNECIVVEDSPRGLQSANAAGLRCVVIPRGMTVGLNFDGAWMRLKQVSDLIPVVESLQNSEKG